MNSSPSSQLARFRTMLLVLLEVLVLMFVMMLLLVLLIFFHIMVGLFSSFPFS